VRRGVHDADLARGEVIEAEDRAQQVVRPAPMRPGQAKISPARTDSVAWRKARRDWRRFSPPATILPRVRAVRG